MAWTIGTSESHTDVVRHARWSVPLRVGTLLALLLLCALWIAGMRWAPWAALVVIGVRLLVTALAAFRAARPPSGGPSFSIAALREGPVELVARAVPPERALLSPLTSTKCCYFDYLVEVQDASGARTSVDAAHKETDFWLKDITGQLHVLTDGIDIRFPPQLDADLRTYDQTPRAVGERLQKLGIDPFVSPGVRRAVFFRETRLDPGDNVLVRGTLVRGADGHLQLQRGPEGLIVERWSRPTFVPVVPGWARRNLWMGAAALLVGVIGLLI